MFNQFTRIVLNKIIGPMPKQFSTIQHTPLENTVKQISNIVDNNTLLLLKEARERQVAFPRQWLNDQTAKGNVEWKEMSKEEWKDFFQHSNSIKKKSSVY